MKIRAIAALLFILISVSAFGEGRIKITGYVRDADGNPLELVNVRVKNTLIGSMTNEKGYYSFSISPGDSISVIYSCLGYNKAERIIPSAQADMRLNVQMNNTSFDLGEVSVTAIRKQFRFGSPYLTESRLCTGQTCSGRSWMVGRKGNGYRQFSC